MCLCLLMVDDTYSGMSQCLYEPLEETVGSEGKLINWQQHGVEVTVPPINHGHVELRVYNGRSSSCFEYPPEYMPLSNVYEIAVSSREGNVPRGVIVAISKFTLCSNPCLLAASRNPSKWTPDFSPVFNLSVVGGMDESFAMGLAIKVILKTSGVYLVVAGMYWQSVQYIASYKQLLTALSTFYLDCQPVPESKKLQLLKPTFPLVEPGSYCTIIM